MFTNVLIVALYIYIYECHFVCIFYLCAYSFNCCNIEITFARFDIHIMFN